MRKTIHYIDMFAGMGGFREGLTRAGDFVCMGHCEIDKYADRSYRALFDTEGEWFIDDARKADPETMPDFELLCGGFPCQAFSLAGNRRGFGDSRGTLFFEKIGLSASLTGDVQLFESAPCNIPHNFHTKQKEQCPKSTALGAAGGIRTSGLWSRSPRQDLEFRHRFPGGIGGQLDVQYRITSGSGEIFKQSLI